MKKENGEPTNITLDNEEIYYESNLKHEYTFNSFVVGSSNKFAYSASVAVAETPGEAYNPLYLYGGSGCGKTHLMHSIGHFILGKNPDCKVLYVTSEIFTNEVIQAIRSGNASIMTELREKFRSVDVLMVDDIQFLSGKESTQEEFFHTINELHAASKQIILSADKAPKDLGIYEESFYSILVWGLVADIQTPDCRTKEEILRKKANNSDKEIEDRILQYIALNINSDIRELEGVFNRIIAKAKMTNTSKITLEFVEEEMSRLVKDIEPENYDKKEDGKKWKTIRKKISKIEKALHKAQKGLSELEKALEMLKDE